MVVVRIYACTATRPENSASTGKTLRDSPGCCSPSRKLRDHKGRPVLAGKDIWSIHYCIMHGTIPFGKNILTYFWERCYWADTLEQAQAKLRVADKFMRKHNIKVYNTLAGFAHTL